MSREERKPKAGEPKLKLNMYEAIVKTDKPYEPEPKEEEEDEENED
jgi:hypothetical protein